MDNTNLLEILNNLTLLYINNTLYGKIVNYLDNIYSQFSNDNFSGLDNKFDIKLFVLILIFLSQVYIDDIKTSIIDNLLDKIDLTQVYSILKFYIDNANQFDNMILSTVEKTKDPEMSKEQIKTFIKKHTIIIPQSFDGKDKEINDEKLKNIITTKYANYILCLNYLIDEINDNSLINEYTMLLFIIIIKLLSIINIHSSIIFSDIVKTEFINEKIKDFFEKINEKIDEKIDKSLNISFLNFIKTQFKYTEPEASLTIIKETEINYT